MAIGKYYDRAHRTPSQTCGLHDACQPGKYCPILPVHRSDQRDIPRFDGRGPCWTLNGLDYFILLVVYVFVMALAERASYRANFRVPMK